MRQLVDDHIPTITSAVSLTLVAFENLLRGAWWWYAFVLREKNVRWDWLDCFCWTSLMPNMTSPHFSLPPSKEEIKNDFALFKISFFFYETKVVITSKRSILMYNKILGLCMLLLLIFLQLTQSDVGWPAIRLILLFLVYQPYTV